MSSSQSLAPAPTAAGSQLAPGTPRPSLPPLSAWSLVAFAIPLLALTVAIFWDSLVQLERVWNVDPSYSHGYLVPLASLGFAALAWQRGRPDLSDARTTKGMITGATEVLLGLTLHAVAFLLSLLLLDVIALICIVRGLLLLVGGPSLNAKFGFAAIFLIFMAPLPAIWQQYLALWMQHFVSAISTASLEILGIAAYRQGYIIQLTDYTMEVGDACSGLRQLTAIVALSVAVGEIYRCRSWSRWLIALLALPVAVGANCFRVTMTGVIMVLFGPEWAEGVFHTLEGLFVTALAAAALMVIAWSIGRLEERFGWRKPTGASP